MTLFPFSDIKHIPPFNFALRLSIARAIIDMLQSTSIRCCVYLFHLLPISLHDSGASFIGELAESFTLAGSPCLTWCSTLHLW